MDTYTVSNSTKVQEAEKDLAKEITELQNEIEDASMELEDSSKQLKWVICALLFNLTSFKSFQDRPSSYLFGLTNKICYKIVNYLYFGFTFYQLQA